MDFWRTMPKGMLLRSNWTATSIADYVGPLSLTSYCESTGTDIQRPVPLDNFIDYGMWVRAAVAPDVDRRRVVSVEQEPGGFVVALADGDRVAAHKVVVAGGIAPFVNRPEVAAHLPHELASHTADHRDFSRFSGKQVLVVGGGQSALECAALIREAGAFVEVFAPARKINWLQGAEVPPEARQVRAFGVRANRRGSYWHLAHRVGAGLVPSSPPIRPGSDGLSRDPSRWCGLAATAPDGRTHPCESASRGSGRPRRPRDGPPR